MKNKLTLGIMALGVIALLGIGLVSAFPMMGGNWDITSEDKEDQEDFMNQIRESIEAENFAEWQTLMQSQITLENFNEHVERHSEREELREQKEQCIEDPENCDFEGWEGKGKYYGEKEGCTGNSETCPNAGEWQEGKEYGQMHKDFNQETKKHRWAFWKGFGKNRA
jgi:hypothetical protein